jgi:DNA-binding MarR family transcriptional regulator
VTSGAITKQVDRLVAKGLVTREVDPYDGRGRRVALTDDGHALVDQLIGTHLDNERRLLSPLTSGQQRQLASLLGVLAEALEGDR